MSARLLDREMPYALNLWLQIFYQHIVAKSGTMLKLSDSAKKRKQWIIIGTPEKLAMKQ